MSSTQWLPFTAEKVARGGSTEVQMRCGVEWRKGVLSVNWMALVKMQIARETQFSIPCTLQSPCTAECTSFIKSNLDFSVSLGESFCSSTMCIHFECNLDHIGNWTLQSTLIVFSQLGNVCTYLLLEFGHALVQIPEKPKFSIAILPRGTLVLIFVPGSHF